MTKKPYHAARLNGLPLFVHAGSVLPRTPPQQSVRSGPVTDISLGV